jgi:hypothetical protein
MKAKLLVVLLLLSCGLLAADPARTQESRVEAEIRRLEQAEVKAIMEWDKATLEKLWDKKYVVNNPYNQIVVAGADPTDRPVLQNPRTSFKREVDHITVRGDVVISMGREEVVPGGDQPKAGKTVKRRYTNIWMKVDGEWMLVARHANEICDGQ